MDFSTLFGGKNDSNDEDSLQSTIRTVIVFIIIMGVIFGGLYAYTQHWPPLVVNETGSMTHMDAPYGRIGTIDAGDMFLVKKVDSTSEITTLLEGEQTGHRTYGDYGDVLIYMPNGDPLKTPIIHRAMAHITVTTSGGVTSYVVDGHGSFGPGGITLAEWGLVNYKPAYSGYITAGDYNLDVSGSVDQNSGISSLVKEEWIVGKSVGEIPWFGLMKIWAEGTLLGNDASAINFDNAPDDCKTMLLLSLATLIALPFLADGIGYLFNRMPKK